MLDVGHAPVHVPRGGARGGAGRAGGRLGPGVHRDRDGHGTAAVAGGRGPRKRSSPDRVLHRGAEIPNLDVETGEGVLEQVFGEEPEGAVDGSRAPPPPVRCFFRLSGSSVHVEL